LHPPFLDSSDLPDIREIATALCALQLRWGTFCEAVIIDELVKSRKSPVFVIPAKAGIQELRALLDPGFRRGDGFRDFFEPIIINCPILF